MHPDVHKFLDGEIARSALSPEALADLAEWEAVEPAIVARRAEGAPLGLANDVMRALPQPRAAPWHRAWQWLITPRPIRIPPLAPLAAGMAAVIALIMIPVSRDAVDPAPLATVTHSPRPTVYVQFVLTAAGAQSVSVAGDFNNWSTDTGALRDADGDGVWVGLVAVQPGVHKYMFVVNGQEWVTDPRAEGYIDDGFGMRNALLAVAAPQVSKT